MGIVETFVTLPFQYFRILEGAVFVLGKQKYAYAWERCQSK
jgi:hypothetical protein